MEKSFLITALLLCCGCSRVHWHGVFYPAPARFDLLVLDNKGRPIPGAQLEVFLDSEATKDKPATKLKQKEQTNASGSISFQVEPLDAVGEYYELLGIRLPSIYKKRRRYLDFTLSKPGFLTKELTREQVHSECKTQGIAIDDLSNIPSPSVCKIIVRLDAYSGG